jgi:hypothetical protein
MSVRARAIPHGKKCQCRICKAERGWVVEDEYRDEYQRGWRSTCDLDYADRRGYTASAAWMDGRTDAAQGLAKWHRRDCPDRFGHQHCK